MNSEKTCSHLLEHLSEYIDGDLDNEALCEEIEAHLKGCENCRVVYNTLEKTVSLYQQSAQQTSLPNEVRRRLFRELHMEDYLDTDTPAET